MTGQDVQESQVLVRADLALTQSSLPFLTLLSCSLEQLLKLNVSHRREILLDSNRLRLRRARAGEVLLPSLEEEEVGCGGLEGGLMLSGVELFNGEVVCPEDCGQVALETPVADGFCLSRGGVNLVDVLVECRQAGCPQQVGEGALHLS